MLKIDFLSLFPSFLPTRHVEKFAKILCITPLDTLFLGYENFFSLLPLLFMKHSAKGFANLLVAIFAINTGDSFCRRIFAQSSNFYSNKKTPLFSAEQKNG